MLNDRARDGALGEAIAKLVRERAEAHGIAVAVDNFPVDSMARATMLGAALAGRHWYDVLSDEPSLVLECARAADTSPVQFLWEVVTRIRPPNRDALRWEMEWFKGAAEHADLEARTAALQAQHLREREAEALEARTQVGNQMNDKKHKNNRKADARIPGLWAEYRARGVSKTQAAPEIAKLVALEISTVRRKLQGL